MKSVKGIFWVREKTYSRLPQKIIFKKTIMYFNVGQLYSHFCPPPKLRNELQLFSPTLFNLDFSLKLFPRQQFFQIFFTKISWTPEYFVAWISEHAIFNSFPGQHGIFHYSWDSASPDQKYRRGRCRNNILLHEYLNMQCIKNKYYILASSFFFFINTWM